MESLHEKFIEDNFSIRQLIFHVVEASLSPPDS